MFYRKSGSLNQFPVTNLRAEVQLMYLLRMRRQYRKSSKTVSTKHSAAIPSRKTRHSFTYLKQATTHVTRGSATAEEPRDVLCQLKYYGRFLTELSTRSSANAE